MIPVNLFRLWPSPHLRESTLLTELWGWVVGMVMTVCWDVALCSLVEMVRSFRGDCCLYETRRPDNGGIKNLWNVSLLRDKTVKYSRRLSASNKIKETEIFSYDWWFRNMIKPPFKIRMQSNSVNRYDDIFVMIQRKNVMDSEDKFRNGLRHIIIL
jgi:hypothetical protein